MERLEGSEGAFESTVVVSGHTVTRLALKITLFPQSLWQSRVVVPTEGVKNWSLGGFSSIQAEKRCSAE